MPEIEAFDLLQGHDPALSEARIELAAGQVAEKLPLGGDGRSMPSGPLATPVRRGCSPAAAVTGVRTSPPAPKPGSSDAGGGGARTGAAPARAGRGRGTIGSTSCRSSLLRVCNPDHRWQSSGERNLPGQPAKLIYIPDEPFEQAAGGAGGVVRRGGGDRDRRRGDRGRLALAGAAAAAASRGARSSSPGCEGRVRVRRDRWGVPHIEADDARDLCFAQGFCHGQDRLWQMDFYRRVGLRAGSPRWPGRRGCRSTG